MRLEILDQARDDLTGGCKFYERREVGLGQYFLACLIADIESLRVFRPLLSKKYLAFHRAFSKRFPFAIYFTIEGELLRIHAVLDCRRHPSWTRQRLKKR